MQNKIIKTLISKKYLLITIIQMYGSIRRNILSYKLFSFNEITTILETKNKLLNKRRGLVGNYTDKHCPSYILHADNS
ncbi:hypothetical protein TMU01_29320 [Tenuibacillus multivorans]|uniref:Uncharacterized protein n=1 Tax=Tenuibacillus multivorans TaxID=237069 RepID=A0A1G9YK69_9BACI|nr:hypothetical protein TMU01_29320 [Tenuibacillus multivorans]SDN08883.1 hypothetical protein SAMN05216498_1421 [Tenuibacillus multivorans]